MKSNNGATDLHIIIFLLHTLHIKGISVKKTISKSLEILLVWYQESKDERYLELAELHMQAYVNMGYVLDSSGQTISGILKLTGRSIEDFYPRGFNLVKQVKLNKSQVRSLIGKWKPSKDDPMTIGEVVDDIIRRVAEHREGRFVYKYNRKFSKNSEPEIYELIIKEEEAYFYDMKNLKIYTFLEE